MSAVCVCPKCSNPTVTRLQKRLDPFQILMLGYFCMKCILLRCDHRHKVGKNNEVSR